MPISKELHFILSCLLMHCILLEFPRDVNAEVEWFGAIYLNEVDVTGLAVDISGSEEGTVASPTRADMRCTAQAINESDSMVWLLNKEPAVSANESLESIGDILFTNIFMSAAGRCEIYKYTTVVECWTIWPEAIRRASFNLTCGNSEPGADELNTESTLETVVNSSYFLPATAVLVFLVCIVVGIILIGISKATRTRVTVHQDATEDQGQAFMPGSDHGDGTEAYASTAVTDAYASTVLTEKKSKKGKPKSKAKGAKSKSNLGSLSKMGPSQLGSQMSKSKRGGKKKRKG